MLDAAALVSYTKRNFGFASEFSAMVCVFLP